MITPRKLILFALISACSLAGYLLASRWTYRIGFPLDDAWIHQTYARNLALHGEWAYWSGQPSAGSTSPLWSGLLATGVMVGLGPYIWTYFLGWALLWAIGVVGVTAFRSLCPDRAEWSFWAGGLLLIEWHLVWAAGSGMETLLFGLLILVVLTWLASGKIHWFALGAFIGLSAWVRPDGITLTGPAVLTLLFAEPSWNRRIKSIGSLILGVTLLFIPYLLFNQVLAGAWWPNTFFAKQAEYSQLRLIPFWSRVLQEAGLPLIGVGAVLSAGFVLFLIQSARRRAWGALAGAVWLVGYVLLYAWRLPVTYQHGRYMMPAMPVFFLWGMAGMAAWSQPQSIQLWRRVVSKAWVFSAVLVLLVFWFLGARAYGRDVAVIESEMVNTARWVADHTPPGDLVAAHDIGALGYFGGHPILDLAGLISPEVIPYIRDEERLTAYLNSQGADYLVTFPGWYPQLTRNSSLLFKSDGSFSPAAGGENMCVYRWPPP